MEYKLLHVLIKLNTILLLLTFDRFTVTDGACKMLSGKQDCRGHDGLCKIGGPWYECPAGTECSIIGFCGGNNEKGGKRNVDTAYEEPTQQYDTDQEPEPAADSEDMQEDFYTEPETEPEPEPESEPEPETEPQPTLRSRMRPAHKPKKLFKPWGESSYLNPPFANNV